MFSHIKMWQFWNFTLQLYGGKNNNKKQWFDMKVTFLISRKHLYLEKKMFHKENQTLVKWVFVCEE